MTIELEERKKYAQIWSDCNYRSKSASTFPHELIKQSGFSGNILEIGCGDGHSAKVLNDLGYIITMSDITLRGLEGSELYDAVECPAWETPFVEDSFDVVFSTDVLEHLPSEKVEDTLKELKRITSPEGWNYHMIATFPDRYYSGYAVHLTVKSITWWRKQFKAMEMNFNLFERTLKN